jgi:PiT family inorganic phosphate transporter
MVKKPWELLFTHGANDGQKTMGIIVLILFSAGLIPELEMPLWVIFAAATAMGLGTFFGGYKVIKTLGVKVTKLKPYQGFAAETGGGLMLGTIMGAGAARRTRAVRWSVGRQIVFAWIITIPGSALMAIGFTYLIHLFV